MIFRREPVAILGALQALLAVAVGFGLSLTNEQTALLLAATAAVLSLVTRSKVVPAGKVALVRDGE